MPSYSNGHIVRLAIHAKFPDSEYIICVTLFNVAYNIQKPFLNIMPQDAHDCLQTSVAATFSFTSGTILAFKDHNIEEPSEKRGALIFTRAMASTQDNAVMNPFAPSKFGMQTQSQCLAKDSGMFSMYICINFSCLNSTSNMGCYI